MHWYRDFKNIGLYNIYKKNSRQSCCEALFIVINDKNMQIVSVLYERPVLCTVYTVYPAKNIDINPELMASGL
jgi:hypothetical protein